MMVRGSSVIYVPSDAVDELSPKAKRGIVLSVNGKIAQCILVKEQIIEEVPISRLVERALYTKSFINEILNNPPKGGAAIGTAKRSQLERAEERV